jgi:hypothetical protein
VSSVTIPVGEIKMPGITLNLTMGDALLHFRPKLLQDRCHPGTTDLQGSTIQA